MSIKIVREGRETRKARKGALPAKKEECIKRILNSASWQHAGVLSQSQVATLLWLTSTEGAVPYAVQFLMRDIARAGLADLEETPWKNNTKILKLKRKKETCSDSN